MKCFLAGTEPAAVSASLSPVVRVAPPPLTSLGLLLNVASLDSNSMVKLKATGETYMDWVMAGALVSEQGPAAGEGLLTAGDGAGEAVLLRGERLLRLGEQGEPGVAGPAHPARPRPATQSARTVPGKVTHGRATVPGAGQISLQRSSVAICFCSDQQYC